MAPSALQPVSSPRSQALRYAASASLVRPAVCSRMPVCVQATGSFAVHAASNAASASSLRPSVRRAAPRRVQAATMLASHALRYATGGAVELPGGLERHAGVVAEGRIVLARALQRGGRLGPAATARRAGRRGRSKPEVTPPSQLFWKATTGLVLLALRLEHRAEAPAALGLARLAAAPQRRLGLAAATELQQADAERVGRRRRPRRRRPAGTAQRLRAEPPARQGGARARCRDDRFAQVARLLERGRGSVLVARLVLDAAQRRTGVARRGGRTPGPSATIASDGLAAV